MTNAEIRTVNFAKSGHKRPPPSERDSIDEGKVWFYFVYIDLLYLGVH
jgi:hypothetical protein